MEKLQQAAEKRGAVTERALIVLWLRMVAEDTFSESDHEYGAICDAADCIERGEHAGGEKK